MDARDGWAGEHRRVPRPLQPPRAATAPALAAGDARPAWYPDVGHRSGHGTWAPPSTPSTPDPPTSPDPPSTSQAAALHLARRATWGATPAVVAEIRRLGVAGWVDRQLDPASIPQTADERTALALVPRLSWSISRVRSEYSNDTGDLGHDIIHAWYARALWSERQLFETVVDTWTDHLVVSAPWGPAWASVHRYQEDVVRKHALGRYADLLTAAVMHPALLHQLDNTSSSKWSPNENLGRELLELHTVGVDAGYTETDVRQSALALTGLTTDRTTGEYSYRSDWHHVGPLRVLGWSHANGSADGQAMVRSYLGYLARHPRTAQRIARRLAVRFVTDTPSATLVDRLAAVYRANDTRIAPVVRELLLSEEFAAARGRKTKRPLENMISTCRVLGVRPGEDTRRWFTDIYWQSTVGGHAPMGWKAPNGYPDVAAAWSGAGATLAVWNFHMGQGWRAEDDARWVRYPAFRSLLPATLPATHGDLVDALAARLLVTPLPASTRAAACAFLGKAESAPLTETGNAMTWRLPYLVALLLDTPQFATR